MNQNNESNFSTISNSSNKEAQYREEFESEVMKEFPHLTGDYFKRSSSTGYFFNDLHQRWTGYLAGRRKNDEAIELVLQVNRETSKEFESLKADLKIQKDWIDKINSINPHKYCDKTIEKQDKKIEDLEKEIESLKTTNRVLSKYHYVKENKKLKALLAQAKFFTKYLSVRVPIREMDKLEQWLQKYEEVVK